MTYQIKHLANAAFAFVNENNQVAIYAMLEDLLRDLDRGRIGAHLRQYGAADKEYFEAAEERGEWWLEVSEEDIALSRPRLHPRRAVAV